MSAEKVANLTGEILKGLLPDAVLNRSTNYLADLNNTPNAGVFRVHSNNTANMPPGAYYCGVVVVLKVYVSKEGTVQMYIPDNGSAPHLRIGGADLTSVNWKQLAYVTT